MLSCTSSGLLFVLVIVWSSHEGCSGQQITLDTTKGFNYSTPIYCSTTVSDYSNCVPSMCYWSVSRPYCCMALLLVNGVSVRQCKCGNAVNCQPITPTTSTTTTTTTTTTPTTTTTTPTTTTTTTPPTTPSPTPTTTTPYLSDVSAYCLTSTQLKWTLCSGVAPCFNSTTMKSCCLKVTRDPSNVIINDCRCDTNKTCIKSNAPALPPTPAPTTTPPPQISDVPLYCTSTSATTQPIICSEVAPCFNTTTKVNCCMEVTREKMPDPVTHDVFYGLKNVCRCSPKYMCS